MASTDDVKKLAALARVSIPEEDLGKFAAEFDSVLAYVGQLEKLDIDTKTHAVPDHRNIFREDGQPHEKGKYTDALVAQFPEKKGKSLSVKQIISND